MHFNLNFFTLLTKGGRQKWLLPIIILSAVSVAVIFMSVLRFGFKKKRTSSYKIQRRKLKSTTLTVTITVKFFRFIFICLEMKVTFYRLKRRLSQQLKCISVDHGFIRKPAFWSMCYRTLTTDVPAILSIHEIYLTCFKTTLSRLL